MEFLSLFLLFFQIFVIYKYLTRLKSVEDMYKDNIQDYFELKAQNTKLECYLKDIDDNNTMLNNKIINLEKDLKKVSDLHNAK